MFCPKGARRCEFIVVDSACRAWGLPVPDPLAMFGTSQVLIPSRETPCDLREPYPLITDREPSGSRSWKIAHVTATWGNFQDRKQSWHCSPDLKMTFKLHPSLAEVVVTVRSILEHTLVILASLPQLRDSQCRISDLFEAMVLLCQARVINFRPHVRHGSE